MALTTHRAAFFDVDNTLVRGSTLYFLGRGMYQRGFFTKADISKFVVANIRFRMTGMEKKEVIEKFQSAATDFIGGHAVANIKKIGEENYNTLKNIADKNYFGVPKFETVSDVSKIQTSGAEKIVILMDLVQDKAKVRKSELEKRLKELQKQIAQLS